MQELDVCTEVMIEEIQVPGKKHRLTRIPSAEFTPLVCMYYSLTVENTKLHHTKSKSNKQNTNNNNNDNNNNNNNNNRTEIEKVTIVELNSKFLSTRG